MSATITTPTRKQIPTIAHQNPITGCFGKFSKDPLAFFDQVYAQYGDIARGRFLHVPLTIVFKADYAKRILQENNKNYIKQQRTMDAFRVFGQENIFTSDGDFWLRQRRLMQPMFHRQRIANFGSIMSEAAQAMCEQWEVAAKEGEILLINKEMNRVTLRIVGQALFSQDLTSHGNPLGEAFNEADFVVEQRTRGFPLPLWIPTHWNRVALRTRETIRSTVLKMIAERRSHPHLHPAGDSGDLLTMLMEARDEETGLTMDDEQVRREAGVMIGAGHETTATSLDWAFYLLAQHPEVEAKLHEEVDRVLAGRAAMMEDVPKLVYTRHVLEEAMRLYPTVWALSRDAAGDDELDGYPIRKGEGVIIGVWSMHRSPAYWDRPNEFLPERFDKEPVRFSYLPFGAGPRLCIGQMFALTEAQIILATVAQRFKLRLANGAKIYPNPVLTLRAGESLPMKVERRG